jgi:hypothetical protein
VRDGQLFALLDLIRCKLRDAISDADWQLIKTAVADLSAFDFPGAIDHMASAQFAYFFHRFLLPHISIIPGPFALY